jgi:hypothetical protein
MGKFEKILRKVLSGQADANIAFDDLCWLLERLDCEQRVVGSHHIFKRVGWDRPLNLQCEGKHAVRYQVKQVRERLEKMEIGDENE